MPVYERETVVDAPLSAVWTFHARIEGLTALTPDWLGLRVEEIARPTGHPGDHLVAGTRVRLSVRPFGLGPRRTWTSVVRESARGGGEAVLRDEMVDGPLPRWVHTHRFVAVDGAAGGGEAPDDVDDGSGEATRVRDVIEYALPGGRPGRALGPLAVVGLEPMFRYRHRRTRALLEDGRGRGNRRRGDP